MSFRNVNRYISWTRFHFYNETNRAKLLEFAEYFEQKRFYRISRLFDIVVNIGEI